MPAADGVDARARRVAARLLPTRGRRTQQRAAGAGDGGRAAIARHVVGGHPARAARVSRAVQAMESEGWVSLGPVHRPGEGRRLIDHLVIGPGGIVVIDSQAWVGRIEVTRGVVQQNGFWREPESADVARTAGSVAALLLPQHRTAVHAVICVAQHELANHFVAPGVHVVGVSGLARLLRSLPRRLHPAEILQLHTQLRHTLSDVLPPEQLTTAELDLLPRNDRVGCVLDVDLPGPGHGLFVPVDGRSLRSAARSAARRRRPPRGRPRIDGRLLAARLLLAVLVAVAAVVFGPTLLHNPLPGPPVHPVVPTATYSPPAQLPAAGARGDTEVADDHPSAAETATEIRHPPPL